MEVTLESVTTNNDIILQDNLANKHHVVDNSASIADDKELLEAEGEEKAEQQGIWNANWPWQANHPTVTNLIFQALSLLFTSRPPKLLPYELKPVAAGTHRVEVAPTFHLDDVTCQFSVKMCWSSTSQDSRCQRQRAWSRKRRKIAQWRSMSWCRIELFQIPQISWCGASWSDEIPTTSQISGSRVTNRTKNSNMTSPWVVTQRDDEEEFTLSDEED